MKTIVVSISETFKQLRLRRQLTVRELGWMSGVNRDTIALIEKGNRLGRIDTMEKLADFFGVDWFDVYCGIIKFNIILKEDK